MPSGSRAAEVAVLHLRCRIAVPEDDSTTAAHAGSGFSAFLHGHERPVTLRWIVVHMIEEYARHNGQ